MDVKDGPSHYEESKDSWVSENEVLKRTFKTKREEDKGGWVAVYNKLP
jgi:hypothetical protein